MRTEGMHASNDPRPQVTQSLECHSAPASGTDVSLVQLYEAILKDTSEGKSASVQLALKAVTDAAEKRAFYGDCHSFAEAVLRGTHPDIPAFPIEAGAIFQDGAPVFSHHSVGLEVPHASILDPEVYRKILIADVRRADLEERLFEASARITKEQLLEYETHQCLGRLLELYVDPTHRGQLRRDHSMVVLGPTSEGSDYWVLHKPSSSDFDQPCVQKLTQAIQRRCAQYEKMPPFKTPVVQLLLPDTGTLSGEASAIARQTIQILESLPVEDAQKIPLLALSVTDYRMSSLLVALKSGKDLVPSDLIHSELREHLRKLRSLEFSLLLDAALEANLISAVQLRSLAAAAIENYWQFEEDRVTPFIRNLSRPELFERASQTEHAYDAALLSAKHLLLRGDFRDKERVRTFVLGLEHRKESVITPLESEQHLYLKLLVLRDSHTGPDDESELLTSSAKAWLASDLWTAVVEYVDYSTSEAPPLIQFIRTYLPLSTDHPYDGISRNHGILLRLGQQMDSLQQHHYPGQQGKKPSVILWEAIQKSPTQC